MPSCRLVDALALPTYDLGAHHPFAPDRQRPLFDLLNVHRLVAPAELLIPEPADEDLLATAHDRAYIAAVRAVSADEPARAALQAAATFGLGTSDNPVVPGQHDAARAVAGATAACVDEVMRGRAAHAFNTTGGLHHAMAAAASGFCIYNDLVVGIRHARQSGAARVLYVDFDVHHGDGVERSFETDPTVMTISFHQDPDVLFPGTGRVHEVGVGEGHGSAVNVPLATGTGDASWLETVRAVLPPITRRFRPDLIVSQHGCDPHREDPLAGLQLTTQAMVEAARLTRELAAEVCDSRWVATGGGGYQPVRVLPRVWAAVWIVMTDREIPDRVDPQWLTRWQHRSPQPLCGTFFDPPHDSPHAARAADTNAHTVTELARLHDLS